MQRRASKWKRERSVGRALGPLELLDWRPKIASDRWLGLRVALWDRERDLVALGWGTSLALQGADWKALAGHCSSVTEQIVDPQAAQHGSPLFFGALPFDSERAWVDWPGGFFVPQLLYIETAGEARWNLLQPQGLNGAGELARLCAAAEAHAGRQGPRNGLARPLARGTENGRAAYEALVTRAREITRQPQSGLEKIVTARRVEIRAPLGAEIDLRHTLEQLLLRQRDCTIFALGNEGQDEFLVGATPELLVEREGKDVSTVSLAGTAPRAAAGSLLKRAKERHEQAVVTRAVEEVLKRYCDNVQVSPPQMRELADLVHLQSTVRGELRAPTHVLELALALHPTPATCGEPRSLAQRWLRDNEELERGLYAGPLGYFDANGNGRFVVALRCARVRRDLVTAYAGAGITAGSNAAAEWSETEHKLRAITGALRVVEATREQPPEARE